MRQWKYQKRRPRLEVDLTGPEDFAAALDPIRTEMREAPRWMNELRQDGHQHLPAPWGAFSVSARIAR